MIVTTTACCMRRGWNVGATGAQSQASPPFRSSLRLCVPIMGFAAAAFVQEDCCSVPVGLWSPSQQPSGFGASADPSARSQRQHVCISSVGSTTCESGRRADVLACNTVPARCPSRCPPWSTGFRRRFLPIPAAARAWPHLAALAASQGCSGTRRAILYSGPAEPHSAGLMPWQRPR